MVDVARYFRARSVGFALATTLLCVVGMLALACSDSNDQPTEQVVQQQQTQEVAEPTNTRPTPTTDSAEQQQAEQAAPSTREPRDPTALLIAEAAALEHNGYWEEALSVRESAIANGGSLGTAELASLRLDRVRLLLRLNRPIDAQTALAEVDDALNEEQSRRHALLRARAALMLSDTDFAVAAMSDYVNSNSSAWAVISLEIARELQRAGRGEEAIEWAERALGGTLPFQYRLRAIHIAATELDIAGEGERALARYDELLQLSPWRDDQAAALSRSAALQRDAGNLDAAREAWSTLVENYSEFSESWEALASLQESGTAVDPLTVGIIRFREQRWAEARTAMLTVLGGSDVLAEQVAGEYYVAAIHDANGDRASAALGYVAVIGRDRTDSLAVESAMRLAEFAVADGDLDEASSYWRQVTLEHPEHRRSSEAARRWSFVAVANSEWSVAAQRFRESAELASQYWDNMSMQEFLLWSALMHREAGNLEAFAGLAGDAADADPLSYYGLRAAELLEAEPPSVLAITVDEWLMRLTGESELQDPDVEGLQEWQAATDLRMGGFDDAADRMWSTLIERLSGDPWASVKAAQLLAERDEYAASAGAAAQAYALFALNWTEAPVDLLRLAYPQPWPEVMAMSAASEGVDPLLLWSLIRRESFYDADAEGLAGEIGLTQVIPLTGSDIAAGLGIEYEHTDLARPELSIRFGAWYLGRQLESFSAEPVIALAAYNAGPGNAGRWQDEAVFDGPDGFLAAMDFPSTRNYVRFVIESLAAYQAIEQATQSQ